MLAGAARVSYPLACELWRSRAGAAIRSPLNGEAHPKSHDGGSPEVTARDQVTKRKRSHLVCSGTSEHDAWIMLHQDTYQQFAAVRESVARGDVLHVFGDVDLSTVAQLDEAIEDTRSDGKALQINLAKCRYFDSSGLAALVRARERFGARLTVLVRPNTGIYRTLQIVGFDKVFNVVTELQTRCAHDERPTESGELPTGAVPWI